jgi:hypothetical protein
MRTHRGGHRGEARAAHGGGASSGRRRASRRSRASHPFIANRGLLLSRGHRADLATTWPKRFELRLAEELNYLLKLFTTLENRRMHQCWWGGCGHWHVMALHSMPAEWANGFGSGCAHFWRQSH